MYRFDNSLLRFLEVFVLEDRPMRNRDWRSGLKYINGAKLNDSNPTERLTVNLSRTNPGKDLLQIVFVALVKIHRAGIRCGL
jgi:hypothetical protein